MVAFERAPSASGSPTPADPTRGLPQRFQDEAATAMAAFWRETVTNFGKGARTETRLLRQDGSKR